MVNAIDTEEGVRFPEWPGWLLMAALAVLCLLLGNFVGELTGFPYYPGYQGTLTQQSWQVSLLALLGVAIASTLMLRIAMVWSSVLDARTAAGLSLVTIAGLSMRAGGMRSIMQAADGSQLFWRLSGELAVLLVIVVAVYAIALFLASPKRAAKGDADWAAAGTQTALFALAMWVLGQSPLKAQGIWSVVASGVISAFLTHLLIGRTWRWSWGVPLVVGILGYIANALTASGVEVAKLSGPLAALAMASPLDYAAVGPIGMMLGEILSREHSDGVSGEVSKS